MAQLYFYYSAMNAGKSTALLQSSYNYQERGMRTLVFTAEIDNRFGVGTVSSRIGLSSQAQLYNSGTSLLSIIAAEHQDTPIHCILLDECQFLTKEQSRNSVRLLMNYIFLFFATACGLIFSANYFPVVNIYWRGRTN